MTSGGQDPRPVGFPGWDFLSALPVVLVSNVFWDELTVLW